MKETGCGFSKALGDLKRYEKEPLLAWKGGMTETTLLPGEKDQQHLWKKVISFRLTGNIQKEGRMK